MYPHGSLIVAPKEPCSKEPSKELYANDKGPYVYGFPALRRSRAWIALELRVTESLPLQVRGFLQKESIRGPSMGAIVEARKLEH